MLITTLIGALIELLIFAGVAAYLYHEVTARTVFRLPYSLFFVGLLKGYWCIPTVSIPLLGWLAPQVYERLKSRRF